MDQVIKNIDVAAGVRIITNIYMNLYWEETNNKQFNKRHQQDFKLWYGVIGYHLENSSVKVSYLEEIQQPHSTIYEVEFQTTEHISVCSVC